MRESDADDKVTKKKQKNNDDQSEGCSKISNSCAQRLLCETQSTDSNQSTQTKQEIFEIEANNEQNKFDLKHILPPRMDNKAAERSRLYRERHKEKINQRRREIRHLQQRLHKIQTISTVPNEQNSQATLNNQLSSKAHTLRQQRYYERHKEEINKRKRDSRRKRNISQSIPATPAERNRNYRERNRQEINRRRRESRLRQQNVQKINTECNENNIDTNEQLDMERQSMLYLLLLHSSAIMGQSLSSEKIDSEIIS